MTASALTRRIVRVRDLAESRARRAPVADALSPGERVFRGALLIVAALALSLMAELLFLSPLQQRAAQQRMYDQFRGQLAEGTAPLAAGDVKQHGAPVAYLEIPSIGLRQVVAEGTSAADLFKAPGHRRDTPLPGQAGTSVVMGRRAAFGGPFSGIHSLSTHALVRVTTGAGVFEYRVIDVRRAGDVAPVVTRSGGGRLALVTADGAPFVPSGFVIVDADLTVPGLGGSRPALSPATLPDSERLLAVDLSTMWRLLLWLQALIVVAVLAVFAWLRWSRAKTWIVFVPTVLFVGLMTAGEVSRILPNLL